MRVNINYSVDIDPEAWDLNFGTGPGNRREDVKEHARQSFIEYLVDQGLLKQPEQCGAVKRHGSLPGIDFVCVKPPNHTGEPHRDRPNGYAWWTNDIKEAGT